MAQYGNYYGNLGQAYTSLTDETPDAKAMPLGATSIAPSYGSAYSGGISVGKPRVNSFSGSTGGVGGVGRDVLSKQKGTRAAQQAYDELKSQEGFTKVEAPIAGAAQRNAVASKRNSLASLLDQYNAQLSGTLRSARFGDPTTVGYEGDESLGTPRNEAFHPIGIQDYDGVDDNTRAQLLSAIQSLTPEELAAASPEFKIWAQHFQKFNVSQLPQDYGTAGLRSYLGNLQQAGVMNPAYVNQFGTQYDGTAFVNDGTPVGSSFNWGNIDSDLANGFLPNAGLNFDQSRVFANESPYPLVPTITSQAMYNPFTNSPVESSKNGTDLIDTNRTSESALSPGFQWGQGVFSTPFAPYYVTGYGDRFKNAPSGSGPQQWAARGPDFASRELMDYVPEANIESTTKSVVGNLNDVAEQTLAPGQRETFSRQNQIPGPKLQEVKTSVPKTNLATKPTIYGETTVDLGSIGAGFQSYRLMNSARGQPNPVADKLNYFGVLNKDNGMVWDAGPPGVTAGGNQHYMSDVSLVGGVTQLITDNNLTPAQREPTYLANPVNRGLIRDTIRNGNWNYAFEGFR